MMNHLHRAKNLSALVAGPALFFLIYYLPVEGLSDAGRAVLACTSWIALWWITEPVDLVVTSLLPILLFPLSGALSVEETTSSYGNPFIYLFLGGFVMGLAIEKWNLHRRIAFKIIGFVGLNEKKVLLGIMVATAFISMWISNTATAIMMLPIGMSVVDHFQSKQPFSRNIMLGIAYASSIGGMATLIGTPPNIILAGVAKSSLGFEISFFHWMLFGVPFSALLLFLVWIYLAGFRLAKQDNESVLQFEPLSPMTTAEKRVLLVVAGMAFLWITRTFIWNRWIPRLDDTLIAIFGAMMLLVLPSGKKGERLLDWKTASRLPWSILILFGAGLAIAKGFSSTDLTGWMGSLFARLDFLPAGLIMLIVFLSINFLTEVSSNTATASIMLPILVTLAHSLLLDAVPLLAGAAISASCAFMLPVATPPNAIVFSSEKLTISQMARTGFVINIVSVILTYLFIRYMWGYAFG